MNIAFFEAESWEQQELKRALSNHTLTFIPTPLKKTHVKKLPNTEALVVFIYSKVTADIIAQLPKLKLIATMSTGYDHIDLEACRKRNIKVATVPFYGENTVAEHTMALILALSRKLPQSIEQTKRGNFKVDRIRGFDLKGKTLGVIGTGHIGQHVIRMAKGFDMNVIAFDVKKDVKLARKLQFTYVRMEKLLAESDIVTLHVPYNKQTHHLINLTNIRKMKKGAYLINTARGGLVDNTALLRAIKSKHLAGAGLDVLEEEATIKEEKQLLSKQFKGDLLTVLEGHMLLSDPRVIITPHNAFNSKEALQRILDTTVENLKAFSKGKKLNLV